MRGAVFPVAFEIQTQKSVALAIAPLVGAAVGAIAAVLYGLTGALGAVMFWTVVPIFLGEPMALDRSLWSRLGIGAVMLGEWLLLRAAGSVYEPLLICIAAQAVPRAAVIALAWISRPAARPPVYTSALTSWGALFAVASGIVAACLAGWLPGTLILISCYLVTRWLRVLAYRSSGGVSQRSLAYARLATEVCVLIVLSVPLPGVFPRL